MKKRHRKKWVTKFGFYGWTWTPCLASDPVDAWADAYRRQVYRDAAKDVAQASGHHERIATTSRACAWYLGGVNHCDKEWEFSA